ncbi:MAG: hypothetical protein ACLSDQ_10185 [Adlercreutzia equolifaciens]
MFPEAESTHGGKKEGAENEQQYEVALGRKESLPARMGRARLNTAVTPRESWAIQRSNELKMGMAQAKTTWASESSRSVATGKRKVFKSTAATMAQAMAMIERARAMRVKQREANQK